MMTISLNFSVGFLNTVCVTPTYMYCNIVYSSHEERDAKTFKRDMVTTAKTKFVISLSTGNGMKEWS